MNMHTKCKLIVKEKNSCNGTYKEKFSTGGIKKNMTFLKKGGKGGNI